MVKDQKDSVIVVFGGPTPDPSVLDGVDLSTEPAIVAADRGLEHAQTLGLAVDVIVGDLDSVSSAAVAEARASNVRVVEFSEDKDASDLELALTVAAAYEPRSILVIGSGRGRLDHVVGNLLVLADRSLHHIAVSARFDDSRIAIVAPGAQRSIRGVAGSAFSVFAVGSEASGVGIEGARWPLSDAQLSPTGALGLSNEVADDDIPVKINVGAGVLAVIQPPPV